MPLSSLHRGDGALENGHEDRRKEDKKWSQSDILTDGVICDWHHVGIRILINFLNYCFLWEHIYLFKNYFCFETG